MEAAARLLTQEMTYRVPEQDLRVDTRRMPTMPTSRVRLTDVRRVEPRRR
jgi:fatty-acid peroxygenase